MARSTPLLPARARRGRPRKFAQPSRAITLTLPERVIEALGAVDGDLGRAIVRLAQPEVGKRPHPAAEIAAFGRRAVIVVNPSRTLEERTGIELLHLPDGRALIAFDQAHSVADLELVIADTLEDVRLPAADRAVFAAIGTILRNARRSREVSLLQRNVIVLETRRAAPKPRRKE